MPPKKKTPEIASKQISRNKIQVYIDRYKEIEIYLTLLTKPLLSNIFPTTPVGNTLYDKVESEIKAFLEQKLQSLTGLDQEDDLAFSKEEVGALKLVASTILSKKEQEPAMPEYAAPENVQDEAAVAEYEQTQEVEQPKVTETESVTVEEVQVSAAAKKMRQRKPAEEQTPVHPTEVPKVDGPTDRVKRSRPKGNIQPLPRLSEQQEAQIAQAQANQAAMMSEQMMNPAGSVSPNNGMPNFNDPNLSFFR